MILEVAASALISHSPVHSRGMSTTAQFVAEQAELGRRRLEESYTFGLRAKGAFDELYHVYKECSESNWDGHNATPVTEATYRLAQQFLEALPLSTPAPSFGAEPDGHITLEWHRSPRRTLSLSISPDGDLHYAALLGESKAYGTEPFFGDAPKSVVDLIQRIMAE